MAAVAPHAGQGSDGIEGSPGGLSPNGKRRRFEIGQASPSPLIPQPLQSSQHLSATSAVAPLGNFPNPSASSASYAPDPPPTTEGSRVTANAVAGPSQTSQSPRRRPASPERHPVDFTHVGMDVDPSFVNLFPHESSGAVTASGIVINEPNPQPSTIAKGKKRARRG